MSDTPTQAMDGTLHESRRILMTDWNDKIDEVDRLIANDHPKQAMQEAGGVLEQLLRHIHAQVASHVNAPEQTKLAAATAKVSAGKPVGEMTLGQLVGLFREGKVFDLAETVLKKKLTHLKGADFNTFVVQKSAIAAFTRARTYRRRKRNSSQRNSGCF